MSVRSALALASIAALGCGGPAPKTPEVTRDADLPPLSAIVREGDPAAVLGVFVTTEGIEPAAGGAAAVALAAVLESRLSKVDARITAQQDGVRADVVFENAGTIDAVRRALLDPIGASDPAHEVVRRKLEALSRVAPVDDGCGSQLSPGGRKLESVETVRASIGLGRIALAIVGGPKAADAARAGLRAGMRWPKASAVPARSPLASFVPTDGKPRVIAHAGAAASAAAARVLGARFSTEMVLHAAGACVRIDTSADPASIASAKRAMADALASSKDASFDAESERAVREADGARDAAQRAAVWALAQRAPKPIGVSVVGPAGLESALARAEADLASRVLDARTRTEPGQGSVWVLLASPCGTESEGVTDAGISALFVTAASNASDKDVALEPWIAADGIGILGHAVRPVSDARVGEVVARAVFSSDAEIQIALPRARSVLLAAVQPALATLGAALAPGHPSWIVPSGTPDALLRVADAAVTTRAASLRAGPWRAAILSDDASMPASAVIDRLVPRAQPSVRACPTGNARTAATPGIYASSSTSSVAYLAFPLEDAATAPWLAAALDGDLLERTLVRTGMVRSASAHLLGATGRAPTLAIFVDAPSSALDAAVLQTRTLVDRLRKSGFTPEESARARSTRAKTELHDRFDPRRRVVDLWRGAKPEAVPSDETLRAATAAVFHDESLVVVAARPRGDK